MKELKAARDDAIEAQGIAKDLAGGKVSLDDVKKKATAAVKKAKTGYSKAKKNLDTLTTSSKKLSG